MHDRTDALFGEDALQQGLVGDVALIERHAIGHGKAKSCDQVVDHHHRPAGILQRENRVAADVAGAAGDEDGNLAHAANHLWLTVFFALAAWSVREIR